MKNPKQWSVPASTFARKTFNPIRSLLETLDLHPNPEKPLISLSIGDPTVFGNLKACDEIVEAVMEVVQSGKHNGYAPSTGIPEAKEAVAKYYRDSGLVNVESKDVILCSGCSCALDLCIMTLASPGQNILVPRPGFSIYKTLAEGLGPERDWEVDVDHLRSLIDEDTAAIVINNPSNPCGSVYSKEHLRSLLQVADEHRVPLIADEIYEYMIFADKKFYSIASLTKNVPVLSCSGLTKRLARECLGRIHAACRFLVPGWRMGWIVIHDRQNIFDAEVAITWELLDFKASDTQFVETLFKEQSCFDFPGYFRIVLTLPEEKMAEACDRIEEFCQRHLLSSFKIQVHALEEAAILAPSAGT